MDTPLGRPVRFTDRYDAGLLAPVERAPVRRAMGLDGPPPFTGEDVWNAYELSWLAPSGMPRVAALRLRMDAASPAMVESKSMKLYLNSFAQTSFESEVEVAGVLKRDVSEAVGSSVSVEMLDLPEIEAADGVLPGDSLDVLDVTTDVYERAPELLALARDVPAPVSETLHTHLFRSLCPVTGQPDWASVLVRYRGSAIDRPSLLRYLISFRLHRAFHEATVEQIYLDLKQQCGCESLLVGGFFLRRGGLDINPFRADPGEAWPVMRLPRQ